MWRPEVRAVAGGGQGPAAPPTARGSALCLRTREPHRGQALRAVGPDVHVKRALPLNELLRAFIDFVIIWSTRV